MWVWQEHFWSAPQLGHKRRAYWLALSRTRQLGVQLAPRSEYPPPRACKELFGGLRKLITVAITQAKKSEHKPCRK
jgi:hypothetical protein